VSVTEASLQSTGLSGMATGTDASNVKNSYRATFQVKCSDQLDTPDIILDYFRGTTSLPWIGRRYDLGNGFDSTVICTAVDPQLVDKSGGIYNVTCRFENEEIAGGLSEAGVSSPDASGKATDDPLKWHPEIEVGFTQISEPAYFARFHGFSPPGIVNKFLRPGLNRPIVNSAMIPYDPTIETEVHIKVVRITVNLDRPPWAMYDRFQGTLNNAAKVFARPDLGFTLNIRPFCGKMAGFGASFAIENGQPFWRETKEIHIHPRSWIRQILDRGMNPRADVGDSDGSGGTVSTDTIAAAGGARHRVLKDLDGFPITEPVLFNGDGQPLEVLSKPVYLLYTPEPDDDWAGIPF
jgi:hypothetical protein